MNPARSTALIAPNHSALPPLELESDALYALGGLMPLDGRMSWAPQDATGFQPANCYLLLRGDTAFVIDPNVPYVEEGVLSGLRSIIGPGREVAIFATRGQLDIIGNIGAIAGQFDVAHLYTGGTFNPFDAFDSAPQTDDRAAKVEVRRSAPEFPLEVIPASLRLLTTYWLYDAQTRTLFTSDSFTHAVLADADGNRLLSSLADDDTTRDDVRAHLFATFPWLPGAVLGPVVDDLRAIFAEREIETIAPCRGRILRGSEVVDRHVDLVASVLTEAAGLSR